MTLFDHKTKESPVNFQNQDFIPEEKSGLTRNNPTPRQTAVIIAKLDEVVDRLPTQDGEAFCRYKPGWTDPAVAEHLNREHGWTLTVNNLAWARRQEFGRILPVAPAPKAPPAKDDGPQVKALQKAVAALEATNAAIQAQLDSLERAYAAFAQRDEERLNVMKEDLGDLRRWRSSIDSRLGSLDSFHKASARDLADVKMALRRGGH